MFNNENETFTEEFHKRVQREIVCTMHRLNSPLVLQNCKCYYKVTVVPLFFFLSPAFTVCVYAPPLAGANRAKKIYRMYIRRRYTFA